MRNFKEVFRFCINLKARFFQKFNTLSDKFVKSYTNKPTQRRFLNDEVEQ